jgi:ribonuclease HI
VDELMLRASCYDGGGMVIEITIYSDGASRGNPGVAGAGAELTDTGENVVGEVCHYLGDEMTNNQAEYRALLLAVEKATDLGATKLNIFADSELMVKQVRGEYRVKNAALKPVYLELMGLLRAVGTFNINHVPREQNKRADKLANLAIDGQEM